MDCAGTQNSARSASSSLSHSFGGAIFYWQLEGWTLLDSVYFCVMTLSTIGFGDLAPTREVSRAFTIVFALLGIGLFASFVAKRVALRLDSHTKRHQKHKHRPAK